MQRNSIRKAIVAASALAVVTAGSATGAVAQTRTGGGLNSVVSCDATGGKQGVGAIIGALAGAAAGSNLSKNDRGTGTAIGAVAGAAAGSWIGCKMQRDEAARGERAWKDTGYQQPYANTGYGYQQPYANSGYRLAPNVQPARYSQAGGQFLAVSTANLRAAPSTGSARVGSLYRGQQFEALAYANGGEWVLVGRNGVGVGYVHADLVRPAGQRYAAGY